MSQIREETAPSHSKNHAPQLSQLRELFPDWSGDDLSSLLQETHGSIELAVERISQGTAQQWGSVKAKGKKPPPAGRDSPRPHAGRGQRGRGAVRGGHRGGPSQRQTSTGSRARPAVPVNGTGLEPSTSTADPSVALSTPTAAPEAPAAVEPKTNGAHAPSPAIASNSTAASAPRHAPPTPAAVPAPSGPPVKSWASLLKAKPAPPPAPAPPKQVPPPAAPAPPQVAPVEPEPEQHEETEPAPEDELHETHADEKEEEPQEQLPSESQQEPTTQPEAPSPVHEEPVTKPPAPATPTPAPALVEHISPPAPAPPQHPPPGLNLVTQQAPLSESTQPVVPAPSRSTPAPIAQKPAVTHRTSARYPKSDQAVVMPSGFEDIVTGVAGFSFGQFGDEVGEDQADQNRAEPAAPQATLASQPPHVQTDQSIEVPSQFAPIQRQDEPSVPPHLNISDQLPQAQDPRTIPAPNQHSQTPLLSHLPPQVQSHIPQQTQQHVPPQIHSHLPPQAQPHIPGPAQSHLSSHPQVSAQSPPIQNAVQQEQQALHSSHLVHTQVHEPFPQHALSGVNLYQQSSHSPFAQQQQPQQPQAQHLQSQPQQLHPTLRQSHLGQQPSTQQSQAPILGTGLGSHYPPSHLELGVGGDYGAFGNLGQPPAAGFAGGPERYGYDNNHSQQQHQGGFYDSPYGQSNAFPSRGASTSEDLNKGSPSQQQSAPLVQNTSQSQPQPQQQQPNQSGQQPYSGIAPMPYFYAPYYQNQYFGQPSPNYGQPFVKYPPMYPQQGQQQGQQQQPPQQTQQPQQQQQPQQVKTPGSLYQDEQYGQGYQQQPQSNNSDYAKTQQQQFSAQGGSLQSLLGAAGQARAPVSSDMGLKGYGTAADKTGRVGQQQTPYYSPSVRYPQHVPHQQGYQQQQPEGNYYSYPGRQPQQPNQNYGQWQ
ncbi:hypothetical protein BDV93DRAFT_522553 [Ceratobasidium sp. AG-I]|nr:hypothetical protein BDV93DRAFT_522553 [Ceratobasidium sp. AG-I]